MTSARPTGIAARVQQALDAGKTREEIIRDLIASGLSAATAERFVERAVLARAQPLEQSSAAQSGPDTAAGDVGGRGSLISGAFWLSLGCTVTGATYLLANPGGKYTIAYGAVVAGLLAFIRGLKRWMDAAQPFPWVAVLVVAALPPLGTGLVVGVSAWRQQSRLSAQRSAEDARVERARAAGEEARVVAERQAADAARAQRHAERIERARDQLRNSTHGMTVCGAALDLGNAGAREAIPDLLALLDRATETANVRNCAASALIKLGETEPALAFYTDCARAGTSDRRRIASGGFGELGPMSASVAIPFLAEELGSPYSDVRYLAVDSLARLGPSAEALLNQATEDSDSMVRERAVKALASLKQPGR